MAERVSGTFTLAASLAQIDLARRWASARLREVGVDEDAVFELELAITEALSNTIRHSYGEDAGRQIEVSLGVESERIEFTILDRGAPFDPSARPPTDLDEPGEGGYGLHLLEQLTDELSRAERADGATLVTLVKYRKPPPTG